MAYRTDVSEYCAHASFLVLGTKAYTAQSISGNVESPCFVLGCIECGRIIVGEPRVRAFTWRSKVFDRRAGPMRVGRVAALVKN